MYNPSTMPENDTNNKWGKEESLRTEPPDKEPLRKAGVNIFLHDLGVGNFLELPQGFEVFVYNDGQLHPLTLNGEENFKLHSFLVINDIEWACLVRPNATEGNNVVFADPMSEVKPLYGITLKSTKSRGRPKKE